MNTLSAERRTAIIAALVEGNSVRSVCRMTGAAKRTVLRLLVEVGRACAQYHDGTVRGIKARRVQCDEIWSFCYAKQKNVPAAKTPAPNAGDAWAWVGLDADSKLAISYLVGDRSGDTANAFVQDLVGRLANRVQLTTDGNNLYLVAVENAFGWGGVDYAMLVKLYGPVTGPESRYSPPQCIGARKDWVMGTPEKEHVSTSFVERQNLTMRMQMRRFTRLTNAFSKKFENHAAAVALHFMHYNFCRVHQTLTKANGGIYETPAMAAGLTDRVWKIEDMLGMMNAARLLV